MAVRKIFDEDSELEKTTRLFNGNLGQTTQVLPSKSPNALSFLTGISQFFVRLRVKTAHTQAVMQVSLRIYRSPRIFHVLEKKAEKVLSPLRLRLFFELSRPTNHIRADITAFLTSINETQPALPTRFIKVNKIATGRVFLCPADFKGTSRFFPWSSRKSGIRGGVSVSMFRSLEEFKLGCRVETVLFRKAT